MVRTIKNTLKKVVGVSSIDYEQLNTSLVEIENIIDSCPLTYMNDENLDESLTPHHLIYGRNIATNKVYPAGIYLLKVNNRNTRTRCEICSKLTINTPERRRLGSYVK